MAVATAVACGFVYAATVRVLAHLRWSRTLARDTDSEAHRAEVAKAIDGLSRRIGELETRGELRKVMR